MTIASALALVSSSIGRRASRRGINLGFSQHA